MRLLEVRVKRCSDLSYGVFWWLLLVLFVVLLITFIPDAKFSAGRPVDREKALAPR